MATKAGGVYLEIRAKDDKLKGDLDKSSKTVTSAATKMQSQVTRAFTVMSVAAAAALAVVAYKVVSLVKDSALLAARFETLDIVMKQVGSNAGYSASQMDAFDVALRKTGISMIESRASLTKMAQAQLDLTKATQLGRIAQDAAVIGNINSSEAFGRMIDGIQTGRSMILRTIGIVIDFGKAYKDVATATDRAVSSFSAAEKTIIRQNAVLNYGSRIAGTYEAAMTTAGKKLNSFTRYVEDFKVKMGLAFGPAMVILIDKATESMKQMQIEISKPETQKALKNISMHLANIVTDLGSNLPEKIDKIEESLSGIVSIYNSLPDGVVGAAGYGILGRILTGSTPFGLFVTGMVAINAQLKKLYTENDLAAAKILQAGGTAAEIVAAAMPGEGALVFPMPEYTQKQYDQMQLAIDQIKEYEKSLKSVETTTDNVKKLTDAELKALQDANIEKYKIEIELAKQIQDDTWLIREKGYEKAVEQAEDYITWKTQNDYDLEEKALNDLEELREDALKEQTKLQEEALKEQEEAYEHMYDNIHDIASDFWVDMLDGETDLWEGVLDTFKSVYAEILAKATTTMIIDVVGSITGSYGSSGSSGSFLSSLGLGSDADADGGSLMQGGSIASSLWGAYSGSTSSAAMSLFTSDLGTSIGSALVGGEAAWLGTAASTGAIAAGGEIGWGAATLAEIAPATTGLASSLASIVPYIGLAVGAISLIDNLFGHESDPPYLEVESLSAAQTHFSEGQVISSDMFDFKTDVGDVGTQEAKDAINDVLINYFDSIFTILDDSISTDLNDILSSTDFGAQLLLADRDISDEELESVLATFASDIFNDLRESLVSSIIETGGESFDESFFTDLATSLGVGTSIEAFAYFSEAIEEVTDFMDRFTRQVEEFGETSLDAFENIVIVESYLEEIGTGLDEMFDSAITTEINTLKTSWEELIDVLNDANISVENLTEIESARNVALGASVTGLSTTALQSAIAGGGDINSILSGSVSNIMASVVAEAISEYYIMPLNEAVGAAIAAGDDLWSITAMVGAYDLSGAQDIVDLYTDVFGTIEDGTETVDNLIDAENELTAARESALDNIQSLIDNIMGGSNGPVSADYMQSHYDELYGAAIADPESVSDFTSFASQFLDWATDYGSPAVTEQVLSDAGFLQNLYSQPAPSFDDGGIISGPMSGYTIPTTFHGVEHITTDNDMKDIKSILQKLVNNSGGGDTQIRVFIGDKELKSLTAETIRTDPETQTQIRRVVHV